MIKPNCWKVACAICVLCASTVAASAQIFTKIFDFQGADGSFPERVSLVQGADGKLYGTTSMGGANQEGTVFKMSSSGALTTLYSFCALAGCTDGAQPLASLVLGTDGNFYGSNTYGGYCDQSVQCGTVFKISPGGQLTTLYSFEGGTTGASPYAALIQATDGNFYGTTRFGGNYNDRCYDGCGTAFRMTPAGRVALYKFCSQNCSDGTAPLGALVQASNGNFYGTASRGGPYDDGTVFEITPDGTVTKLFTFGTEGASPGAGLLQGSDGNFYGTTSNGGAEDKGTIFKITSGGALTTLYGFCAQANCIDGAYPSAGLIQAPDGNFYGTTSDGGDHGNYGTVFMMTPQGQLTTLHSFDLADGFSPAGLVQATNGVFYGTTIYGGDGDCGDYGCGTAFSVDMGLGPFVAFVSAAGRIGQVGGILGQGFTGTTSVSLNGIAASFSVVSDTFIEATVPAGATTGFVTVTTRGGTLTSNVPFQVLK